MKVEKQIVDLSSLTQDEVVELCEDTLRATRKFSVGQDGQLFHAHNGRVVKAFAPAINMALVDALSFIERDLIVAPPEWIAAKIIQRVKEKP